MIHLKDQMANLLFPKKEVLRSKSVNFIHRIHDIIDENINLEKTVKKKQRSIAITVIVY